MEIAFAGVLFSLLVGILRVCGSTIDIPAFEYIRRFNRPLELGECPRRLVAYPEEGISSERRCHLPRRRGDVTRAEKMVTNSRILSIQTPQELMFHIGLCDGKSAAFFGLLLQDKDCVATEMARKLSFGSKSAVRMHIENFRPRMDILDPSSDQAIPPDFSHYGWDSYYVHNIGIGTQEVILVELQFTSRLLAEKARSYGLDLGLLSDYVRVVARHIGVPRKIKVIRMSTAHQLHQSRVFKGRSAIDDVIQWLDFCEDGIEQTKEEIDNDMRVAHLKYGLELYEVGPVAAPLTSISEREVRESWENVTLLEVKANRVYVTYKRYRRYCKGTRRTNPVCQRIQEILSDLKSAMSCIHEKRSSWSSIDFEEQKAYVTRMLSVVKAIRLKLRFKTKYLKKAMKRING